MSEQWTIETALATQQGSIPEANGIGFFRDKSAVDFLVETGKYKIKMKNAFGYILEEIKEDEVTE